MNSSLMINHQRGVALLAAIVLVFAVTVILTNIFYRHQIEVSQLASSLHNDQALLIALSGEGWAIELLRDDLTDPQTNDSDHTGEIWAQAMPLLPVEGGTLTGCISDLQSRINLNNFSRYNASALQTELNQFDKVGLAKTWLNLLESLDIPPSPSRVATIVDWIDADATVVNSWGAEQPDYESFDPPRVVANGQLVETTELADIAGYTIAEVQALLPWVSALPLKQQGSVLPINVNTAGNELLFALGGSYGQQFVDAIIDGRPFSVGQVHEHLNDYLGLRDPANNNVGRADSIWAKDLITETSNYFQLYLKAQIGEAELEVTSIIERSNGPQADVNVIAREIAKVPAVLPKKTELTEMNKQNRQDNLSDNLQQGADIDADSVQPACLMMDV